MRKAPALLIAHIFLGLLSSRAEGRPVAQSTSTGASVIGKLLLTLQVITLPLHLVCLYEIVLTLEGAGWLRKHLPIPIATPSNTRQRKSLLLALPVPWMAMLAFAVGKLTVVAATQHPLRTCDELSIDPDIAGIGVRTGLYGLGDIAAGIALLGRFHAEETSGAGELVVQLWIYLTVYLVNIFKGFSRTGGVGGTSSANITLAAVMLDAYVSALSMTLAMKECLVHRSRARTRIKHAAVSNRTGGVLSMLARVVFRPTSGSICVFTSRGSHSTIRDTTTRPDGLGTASTRVIRKLRET